MIDTRLNKLNWLPFLCCSWLLYLFFNTKNPINNFFAIQNPIQLDSGQFSDTFVLLSGPIIYCAIAGLIMYLCFKANLEVLISRISCRTVWLGLGMTVIRILLSILGIVFENIIPTFHSYNLDASLENILPYEIHGYWVQFIRELFTNLGTQMIILLVFIYLLTRLMSRKSSVGRLVLIYVITIIISGGLTTTGTDPYLLRNIFTTGIAEIPMLILYQKSHNVPAVLIANTICLSILYWFV
jgi:hypothetical protein